MNPSPEFSPPDPNAADAKGQNSEPPLTPEEQELEQALLEVDHNLAALKERYAQVQRDRRRKAELKNRIDEIQPDLKRSRSKQLREELRHLEAELETIELNLESSLFTWNSLREPFWQAVRFGGLGVVIGWILKACAG